MGAAKDFHNIIHRIQAGTLDGILPEIVKYNNKDKLVAEADRTQLRVWRALRAHIDEVLKRQSSVSLKNEEYVTVVKEGLRKEVVIDQDDNCKKHQSV